MNYCRCRRWPRELSWLVLLALIAAIGAFFAGLIFVSVQIAGAA